MDGLIILQLFGEDGEINRMYDELKVSEGVTPKIIDSESQFLIEFELPIWPFKLINFILILTLVFFIFKR